MIAKYMEKRAQKLREQLERSIAEKERRYKNNDDIQHPTCTSDK